MTFFLASVWIGSNWVKMSFNFEREQNDNNSIFQIYNSFILKGLTVEKAASGKDKIMEKTMTETDEREKERKSESGKKCHKN